MPTIVSDVGFASGRMRYEFSDRSVLVRAQGDFGRLGIRFLRWGVQPHQRLRTVSIHVLTRSPL